MFLCVGGKCAPARAGRAELGPPEAAPARGRPAGRRTAACCAPRPTACASAPSGPIAVVYPEGIVVSRLHARQPRPDRRAAPAARAAWCEDLVIAMAPLAEGIAIGVRWRSGAR
ncbi:MAG: hypothetical protein MZW92_16025 [Comamonadaceae bacterium]|nr:hypothetical protein [Comamonadaceae bacterium]